MDEFVDYLDKDEQKLLAKQARCFHNKKYFILIKCCECSKCWSEKTLKDLREEIKEI